METRLKFIKFVKKDKWGKKVGLWKCRCGNKKEINCSIVNTRKTLSCGCLQKEIAATTIVKVRKFTSHKMSDSRIYRCWTSMKQRCYLKSYINYNRYGGRGIKVCKRWMKFENFLEDMVRSYKEGLTLDRINNNKNYTKGNCRWATQQEQTSNTSRNVKYRGETASEASRRLGGNNKLVAIRIREYGWTKKKAFTHPRMKIRKNIIELIALQAKYQ